MVLRLIRKSQVEATINCRTVVPVEQLFGGWGLPYRGVLAFDGCSIAPRCSLWILHASTSTYCFGAFPTSQTAEASREGQEVAAAGKLASGKYLPRDAQVMLGRLTFALLKGGHGQYSLDSLSRCVKFPGFVAEYTGPRNLNVTNYLRRAPHLQRC